MTGRWAQQGRKGTGSHTFHPEFSTSVKCDFQEDEYSQGLEQGTESLLLNSPAYFSLED